MDDWPLSDVEARFVNSLERAQPHDCADATPPIIRAETLRRLLLGLPVTAQGQPHPRLIPLHPTGLRLRGAVLTGALMLDDAAAPDGALLPPLILTDCVIPAQISLCRARLRHFSLADSRITHLFAQGIVVDGRLDLSGLASAEPPGSETGANDQGLCWVDLRGARIAGSVRAPGARLVAPPSRPGFPHTAQRPEHALDLRAATIGNELILLPGFSAVGGVTIRSARVDKDIVASGSTLTAVEGGALVAAGATIGGSVLLNVFEDANGPCRFSGTGDISFLDAVIGGSLELNGAAIQRLGAANARIGGTVSLSAWNRDTAAFRFSATEDISLNAARITGSLDLAGASLGSISAQNCEVGGSAFLRASSIDGARFAFQASGNVSLAGAKIAGDLDLSGAAVRELGAQNADIGGNVWLGVRAGFAFAAVRWIDLSGSQTRNTLIVRDIKPDPGLEVDLRQARVEVLDDNNGAAWGEDIVLRLDGFKYASLAIGEAQPASRQRLQWLTRQYPRPGRQRNDTDYSPDAYERLTQAFRATGNYADARSITRARLRIERQLTGWSFTRPFRALYDWLFDSGQSPARAATTFIACVMFGWLATNIADHGSTLLGLKPVLMLETSTVNSLVVPGEKSPGTFRPGLLIASSKTAQFDELACGDDIEPLLYALDVFVPALELHQEGRCSITTRAEGFFWRLGRAIYSLIGWIVTALTVLTISGVARRHLEG
jgi:hypothetical protein